MMPSTPCSIAGRLLASSTESVGRLSVRCYSLNKGVLRMNSFWKGFEKHGLKNETMLSAAGKARQLVTAHVRGKNIRAAYEKADQFKRLMQGIARKNMRAKIKEF